MRLTRLLTLCLSFFIAAMQPICAATVPAPQLDGKSATAWTPYVGWVTKPPLKYGVTNEGGTLVFSAEGAGTEMPWGVKLDGRGVSGDERYLLVRYRGRGLSTNPGIYFLHGEEGSHGGKAYALANNLEPDNQWHTLAIDLLLIEPFEPTHALVLKVFVGESGSARLEVAKLWFADEVPVGAKIATPPIQRSETNMPVSLQATDLYPRSGWTAAPASDYTMTADETGTSFTVREQGKGMRWLMSLPTGIDLARMPYLSLRYKASGALGNLTYAVWLGDNPEGSGGKSAVAIPAGDLQTDGRWHNLTVKVGTAFKPTQLAIGLDNTGAAATMTLSNLTFSSQPLRWAVQNVLPYKIGGKGSAEFVVAPVTVSGGKPSAFLRQRLSIKDWFTAPHVSVAGVPFDVPVDAGMVAQTPTAEFGSLSLKIPAGTREIYLLTGAAVPATEPWGIDWANPRPVETLDVPEKIYYEIRYKTGPADRVLPLDLESRQWGMRRGLSVNVVHPDPARQATAVVLHDRMQTAGFALVAATMRRGHPAVAEPSWNALAYPPPPVKALTGAQKGKNSVASAKLPQVNAGVLQATFQTAEGLSWSNLQIAGLAGRLSSTTGPLFEVRVGGKLLPAGDWKLVKSEARGMGKRFVLHNTNAGLGAIVECAPGKGNELLLRMKLVNEGKTATTATLHFPVLRGLRLGSNEDTWYLSGQRGGIISNAAISFRDPLGERHPLQMDGFFNPRTGIALGCLTHDTKAQHHFINLSKSQQGGAWSIEYVERDLAPGAAFEATEAALVLREGDWRAIFGVYRQWLKTWFKPAAPRKPWFEKSFAFVSGNVHYDAVAEPKARANVQPLIDTMMKYIGVCDYVHLFGWGASRQYGDWGDYDHYDEIGGLDYFRSNIKRIQDKNIAVSLYLDGYLSSEKGQFAGSHAREWAMKKPDGSPQFVPVYQSYNECPYNADWRKYLSSVYRRVQKDLDPRILYIDEIGSTDGRWMCHAKDHGHNGYEIPYAGEVGLLKAIRDAVGPQEVLYTEYPPAEVSRRYTDGSITYQALWSTSQQPLAPHFIDLPRFAFPDFKQLHIIYYVPTRAGNWWLFKFPFFNGEVYRIGAPGLQGMDAPSLAFQKRAVQVQCAHREAFASHDVQPLVRTEIAGVFANLFITPRESVWTLYNANGRNVRKPVLRVKHLPARTMKTLGTILDLNPTIKGGYAYIAVDLGPKAIGCVARKLP